jgi:hypothetical protein
METNEEEFITRQFDEALRKWNLYQLQELGNESVDIEAVRSAYLQRPWTLVRAVEHSMAVGHEELTLNPDDALNNLKEDFAKLTQRVTDLIAQRDKLIAENLKLTGDNVHLRSRLLTVVSQ